MRVFCRLVFLVLLYTKLFRTHLSADLQPKELCTRDCTIRPKYNIIYACDMSPSANIYIYIHIINHPDRSHAVEKR